MQKVREKIDFEESSKGNPMSCKKTRYSTAEQAGNAMRKMWRNKIGSGKLPTRSYACSDCLGFHLTSQPQA